MVGKKQKISLCMFAKNAESTLEKCLESVKGLVDEIVIAIDDSTTDNTEKIAKKFNAQVSNFKWNYDYSEARNIALQNATGDWILILDADETLSKNDHKKIDIAIYEQNVDAYSLIANNFPIRLFRNKKDYRFVNPINETIEESITDNHGKIKSLLLKIEKSGTNAPVKASTFLNATLKKAELFKIDPKHFFDAGILYLETKDYEKAIEMFYKAMELNPRYRNVVRKLAEIFFEQKYYDKALELYQKQLELNPKDVVSVLNLGTLEFNTSNFENAEKYFKKAIEMQPESVVAYDKLIAVFLKTKQFERAGKTAALAYKVTKIPRFGEIVVQLAKKYPKAQ